VADLVVDTLALRAAAGALETVAEVADAVAAKHGSAAALVSAIGYIRPTNEADSFISEWTYGAGWIASHARHTGAYLTTTAGTYEAIESMLASAAGGSTTTSSFAPVMPPVEEPVRRALRMTPGMQLLPASLATARTARDLIPGEPDLVADLGRRLVHFADQLADARIALMRISLGTWVGASAEACAADLEDLAGRVRAAEMAFFEAGDAVNAYAPVHADAQAQASRALALWQAAAPAAAILRGTAVGPLPVGAPADPEADLARAGALFQDARSAMDVAAKALAERLIDAQRGAPNDPGFFSKVRRAVESFVVGTAEGAAGIVEDVVAIGGLAYRLDPLRGIYDPKGYREAQDALWAAVAHTANPTHWGEVGSAFIDLDTWKDDPFEAAGKLVPDIAAILASGGAAGAAKGAETEARISGISEVVAKAEKDGVYRLGSQATSARMAELGVDSTATVGSASAVQLESAWAKVDQWVPTTFEPGQRFAVIPGKQIGAEVADTLPTDARYFYEGQQAPALRAIEHGTISAPMYGDSVIIYEIRSPIEGATARALANPELGQGGSMLTHVPDLDRAIEEGRVAYVRDHHFSPSTLDSRFEDPRYRMVDDSLIRALNPSRERLEGYVEGGAHEFSISARQTAITMGSGAASNYIDKGAP
jgi:hypothetical protein